MNCRCSKCGARRTMRHPDMYVRPPKCPRCKGTRWRVDRHRMFVEKKARPCRCVEGYYPFPHRRGSKWCAHNTSWTAADAEESYGGAPIDFSWMDDPLSFGQRGVTGDEAPF